MLGKLSVREPGKELEVLQELACVSSPGQSGLCSLSDKQIPSLLMAQAGLSVPELAGSVTGSNRHRLFHGAKAALPSLLSCVGSLSWALPLFPWNELLWVVSWHRGRPWAQAVTVH